MDIKGLNKFITDLKPQSRLQLVVIKTLLENDCHATTKTLARELGFYNKEHPDKYYKSTVFSILEDKHVISQSGHQEYSLNFRPNNAFDVLEAISLCNQKIHLEKIKPNVRYFMAVGPWKSWKYTIKNLPLRWGVDKKTTTKSPTTYNKASKGDIVFYYSTREKPTNFTKTGFFGIGVVKKTRSITEEKYWPKEKEAGKTLFTYKILLDTLKFARSDQELIPISDGLPLRRGFSHTNPGKPLDELLENTKNKWNIFVSSEKQLPSDRKITPEEFESLIKRFDKERTIFDKGKRWQYYNDRQKKEQREEFVSKFPIDKIQDIAIDEYAEGLDDKTGDTNRSSFSYMVEFGTRAFGSPRGGTARKLGIYYSRLNNRFWYPKTKHKNYEEAFEAVLSQIQKIVDAGKDFAVSHNVQKLSNIIDGEQYIIQPSIRSKILSIYFCNTFLAISSEQYLNDMLVYFKIPREQLDGEIIQKQFKLIEQKKKHPIMKNWSTEDYSHFLWSTLCTKYYTQVKTDEEEKERKVDPTKPAPFHLPLGDELENIKKLIQEDLLIDGSIIDRIIASLYAGRNVLLTGQVGTGKTDLAQKISKVLNYYPEVHTATSDWSTQDVIGGIFPKIEKGAAGFRMQDGCVISTISKNWEDRTGSGGVRKSYPKFDRKTGKPHHYRGVWLVIDEFNRANIDRAFGQLFTALEYKEQLKMPIESSDDAGNGDFQTFIIPKDYRIIGTLNTHDRHFLFNLSDALKRRFDFIEIGIPPRDPENREISMVHKKVAADSELSNGMKELDSSNEQTDKKLYEIVLFIRKSKPIGTALLISMLRDMLVYHKMGQSWDGSLDSALAKTIIPQIEDLPASTLGSIKRFVNGDMASFFVKFSRHDHAEKVEDYVKELEKYETYYRERFKNKVSKKWSHEFKEGNLSKLANQPRDPEQTNSYKSIVEELNPWQEGLKRPALALFKKSLDSLAEEKESFSVNVLESGSG